MVTNLGSKIIRGKFLTTYSLLEVYIYFYEIPRAKIRFFHFFRSNFNDFQICKTRLEGPKISKFPKSSLYTFLSQNSTGNPMQTSKKWLEHGKRVFWALFDSCWQHFDPQNTYFDVFLTFLPYCDHHAHNLGARGVHTNSKKLKSPEMVLNTPKLS